MAWRTADWIGCSAMPILGLAAVEGKVITLLQLMESMFELGFLDVSDMRWRAPTKTFRKEL